MISQTAEYALRALTWLAQHGGSPRTVQEIAAATSMPPEYLSKVLQDLARAGALISQRGPSGGYRLARKPQHICVYEIVQALSPLQRIHDCPLGHAEHKHQLCTLHQLLDDAAAAVECAFRKVTIADLLNGTQHAAGVDAAPAPLPSTSISLASSAPLTSRSSGASAA